MPIHGKGNKKSSQKNSAKSQKGAAKKKTRATSSEIDSGHVSPVESSTQLDDLDSCGRDWKDDIIDFYRSESSKAWKCFLAVSLERYHMLLGINRRNLDLTTGADTVMAYTSDCFLPQQRQQVADLFESDRRDAHAALDEAETSAVVRFLAGIESIDAGKHVKDMDSIDPAAGLHHFEDLVSEVTTPAPHEDEANLSLSFTGSINSEDSGCVLTSRSDSSVMTKGSKARSREQDDLLILKGSMRSYPVIRGTMGQRHDQDNTSKTTNKGVSVMTQYEEGDFGNVPTGLRKRKILIDGTTQTDPASTAVDEIHVRKVGDTGQPASGGNDLTVKKKDSAVSVAPSANGEVMAKMKPKQPSGKALGKEKIEGDPVPKYKDRNGDSNNAIGNINKEGSAGGNNVRVKSDREADVKKKQIPAMAIKDLVYVDDLERVKQIEEDENFARELAKTWGLEQSQATKHESLAASHDTRGRGRHHSEKMSTAVTSRPQRSDTSVSECDIFGDAGPDRASGASGATVVYNSKQSTMRSSTQSHLNKTRICYSYRSSSSCPWGKECIYAHGEKELRPVPDWFNKGTPVEDTKSKTPATSHPEPCDVQGCPARLQFFLRKTSMCKQYLADRCRYTKVECKFAHGTSDLVPLPKYELCKRKQAGKCSLQSSECVYAHSKAELRPLPRKLVTNSAAHSFPKGAKGGWANPADNYGFQAFPVDDKIVGRDWGPNTEDCIICSEIFKFEKDRFQLVCGHNCFHWKCIGQWLDRESTCPICRKEVHINGMFKPPLGGRPSDYPPLA